MGNVDKGSLHIGFRKGKRDTNVMLFHLYEDGGYNGECLRDVQEILTGVSVFPDRYQVFTPAFVMGMKRYGLTPESLKAMVEKCMAELKLSA